MACLLLVKSMEYWTAAQQSAYLVDASLPLGPTINPCCSFGEALARIRSQEHFAIPEPNFRLESPTRDYSLYKLGPGLTSPSTLSLQLGISRVICLYVLTTVEGWERMLFPEEDSPLLKAWIVKRLENTFVIPSIPAAALTLDSQC